MSKSQQNRSGSDKGVYPTLAAAIRYRNKVARTFGKRFRGLRIYRTADGWCLTKWTKGQYSE